MTPFRTTFLLWILTLISATDAVVLNKFGTKTTYNASFANSTPTNGSEEYVPHCQPLQVIVLSRHGTRYPSVDDIEGASRIAKDFRNRGAKPAVVDELEKVLSVSLPISKAKELAATGAEEMHDIGYRFANKYLKLFSTSGYKEVSFVSSSSNRAIDSCLNFQKGFVDDHRLNVSTVIQERDDLLRFFDLCPRYEKEVENNKTAYQEQDRFQQIKYHEINSNIASHLNIPELRFSADELNSLFKIAACEVAIAGSHYWADLLRDSDLGLLEYSDDLEGYWELGYGHPINYQQSCPLLANIFRQMDSAVNGEKSKKGTFFFGHAETLMPLMSLLGLFKDNDPLRADNYDNQQKRSFKTSNISPFSSNLAFVLYKCNSTTPVSHVDPSYEYKVQVFHKEQPILLPHVCYDTLCSYDVLRRYYSSFIDGCDFNATCSLPSSENIQSTSNLLILVLVLLVTFLFSS